jgi:hypothetical protein
LQRKEGNGNKLEKIMFRVTNMANSNAIQVNCRFKIAKAREKSFELSENTRAVYGWDHHATNDVTAIQMQSGDMVKIKPGCCEPWII